MIRRLLPFATLLILGGASRTTAESALELEVDFNPKLAKYVLTQRINVVATIRNRAQYPTAFWKGFYWDLDGTVHYRIEDKDGQAILRGLYRDYWGRERRTVELTVLGPGEEVTFSRAFTISELVLGAGSYRMRLAYSVRLGRFEKHGELSDASIPIADPSVPIEGLTSFVVVEHEEK